MKKPSLRFKYSVLMTALTTAAYCSGAPAQTSSPNLPDTAAAWAKASRQDINEAYQVTLDNHPGTYDRQNPGFKKHLDQARDNALALADQVKDAATYSAVLNRFNVSIHDGHAGARTTFPASTAPAARWPGFITVWRDKGLYVYAAEAGKPDAGSEVISCDGKPAKQLIADNVFSFKGRSEEAGHWWVYSGELFVDKSNPFITLPKACQFAYQGKTTTHALQWQDQNQVFFNWAKSAYAGEKLALGISEPRKNLLWFAMPTFQPNAEERKTYEDMTQDILEHRERALNADAIVIDLRHNQGGSSAWSRRFAEALWGKDRVSRQMNAYFANTETWWRASQGNTRFILDIAEKFRQENRNDMAAWAKQHGENMQAALEKKELFYVQQTARATDKLAKPVADLPTDPQKLKTPVYVIVAGDCASACLDALDVFTRFDNTTLIGAPSAADSTYMEVRMNPLSSGLASAVIPNKVYVNRPRLAGQVYQPAIVATDLVWSVSSFQKIVENDLVKRK
ncbi:S41 family peptidase [Undibacterium pigrum]|uniref:Peptidase S41-like protein n=1 Tax=Undibacterium pigrum TaxID=401470 RepID=A0A318JAV0_9BURK|nr:S41 family peptidase [Undibacterium pigrum]PXX45167.1 peptidase S41-like protein [Undibacterium pigrum]